VPVAVPAVLPAAVPQLLLPPVPVVEPLASPNKRLPRTPGLAATSAAFLVPDYIRKKFADGWRSHIPLTYLTDKGCLLKNKSMADSSQDVMTFDPTTGQVITTSRTLSDYGELELTFDEWYQAWRRLLDLIKTYYLEEFVLWEIHHAFILNSANRAELWPLYLAYDADICRRATQTSIDLSIFSIGTWNNLEARFQAKKVLNIVQSNMRQRPLADNFISPAPINPPSYTPRNPSHNST
jgi:hypothetical protein